MSRSLKGCYPWLLGATSYVIPADLVTNVQALADKVDAVQLLFFESAASSTLAHPIDILELKRLAADHELTYTVHLPSDIRLGDPDLNIRRQAVDEIVRLVEELSVLSPRCYDLHVHKSEHLSESQWLANAEQSLAELALRLGSAKELVAVENIDYPYGMIAPLVAAYGFSRCLDVGHIHRYGHGTDDMWREVKQARHIHYHGVVDGKDHCAIESSHMELTAELGEELDRSGYDGVVTFEMYSMAKLDASLEIIGQAWKNYVRSKKHDY